MNIQPRRHCGADCAGETLVRRDAAPGFRVQFVTFVFAMMADNIEHVISYWVMFQKFHSPALAGFAIVSHWLPFLLFSVAAGALDRPFRSAPHHPVRHAAVHPASLGWGYFFITDTLQMWQAMVLLVVHGCAGVLWSTPVQVLLYDIVGPADLMSAVRLNATARYLGVLVGPAVGGVILLGARTIATASSSTRSSICRSCSGWCARPMGRAFARRVAAAARRARLRRHHPHRARDSRPFRHCVDDAAGRGASFFVGNAYSAQMPGFAEDLGHGDPGLSYSMLLAADACGAFLAGVLLEGGGLLPPQPRTAIVLAMLWCVSLCRLFACRGTTRSRSALLFAAGFLRAVVQHHGADAGADQRAAGNRGRVIGLFGMASFGLRAFSGVSVGLLGSLIGVHWSLAASALAMLATAAALLTLP